MREAIIYSKNQKGNSQRERVYRSEDQRDRKVA